MIDISKIQDGLKQKIKQLYDKESSDFKTAGTPLDATESFGRMELLEQVLGLLDEATKQIQELVVGTTLEHTHPSPEFWKGWNKAIDRVLAVLEGETKQWR